MINPIYQEGEELLLNPLGSKYLVASAHTYVNSSEFVVQEDSIISVLTGGDSSVAANDIDYKTSMGLSGVTLKQGALIVAPRGESFQSMTIDSGSIMAYNSISGGVKPSGIAPFSFGNALEFDGVNDFVDNINVDLTGLSFTMSLWLEMGLTGSTQGVFSGLSGNVGLFFRTNNEMRIADSDNNAINIQTSTALGQKRNIVISYDGTNMSVWFDGVSVVSPTASSGFDFVDILGLRSGNYLQGVLNEIAISSGYAATNQNVIDLYNSGNGALATDVLSNVIRYYRCNETDGLTTLIDTMGNQNGTLNNFTTPPAYFKPW